MGSEYMGYLIHAAEAEASYRTPLQPAHLQADLRLPAEKSRRRYHDDKGTGPMGITRDGAEIYPLFNL